MCFFSLFHSFSAQLVSLDSTPMASFFHLISCLLLLLVQLLFFTSAQRAYTNITLGESLSNLDQNPYWTSPSGDFAFGFHPHQDLFLLAIWFERIPLKTIIWTANQGNPVEGGATIQLTSNGVLSLTSRNGTEIWKAQPTNDSRVTSAAMLNTGNLVLTTTESTIVWASFSEPTDTILPTQTLELDGRLSSRRTEEDYTIGRFEFILQTDGNLVLYTKAGPTELRRTTDAYYASNTVNNGTQLVFNQSGYIYLTLRSGGPISLASERPESTRDFYQRATLDFDGVFRQYTYPRTLPSNGRWPNSWSTIYSLPEDICRAGSGVCGFNGYCQLNQELRPECKCPPGYTFIDPENTFSGCKTTFVPQSCDSTNETSITDGFEMRDLAGTDWPTDDDYESFIRVDEDWCEQRCLNDCFCAVAIVREGSCWLKKFPLSGGYVRPGTKALIKVGDSSTRDVPPPSTNFAENHKNERNWILPGSILLGVSALLNLLLVVFVVYSKGHKKKKQIVTQTETRASGINLRSFTYKELEEATDGFKEELGKGAFSTVYKGVLKSESGCLVAVKRLNRVVEGNYKEFKAEMSAIGKTNHKNLVQLLGYCDEDAHQLLVYEFMKNGSLEGFLFGSPTLGWNQRIQIAFGIARGLAYLHEDCSSQIIHCDVKPQNILLDDSYVARIADFGLAKLLKNDQTRTLTGIRGTRGYVAPEWFKSMAITAKVDVYSFGIMLLEIICCRKNAEMEVGNDDIDILSDWAYECYVQKALHLLVVNDEQAKNDGKTLERMVVVALWCIQEDPSLRPSMKKVTQMLEGAVEVSMPPEPSSFISSIA